MDKLLVGDVQGKCLLIMTIGAACVQFVNLS